MPRAPRAKSTATTNSDLDDDSSVTPPNLDSGVATPSTAATSVRGGGKKRSVISIKDEEEEAEAVEMDDDEDDEEENIVAAGSRSTPRRSAAAAASAKLKLEPIELTSDLSDLSDAKPTPSRRDAKGKGKAIILSSDSEDDDDDFEDVEMEDFAAASVGSDDGFEEDEEDVKNVKALAKGLKGKLAGGRGGRSQGKAGASKKGKELAKSVSRALKGKGKAKDFAVVIPKYPAKTRMEALMKGKGKAKVESSDDEDEEGDDDFAPSEVDDDDASTVDSDAAEEMAEFLSDQDDEEDEITPKEKAKRLKKLAKAERREKVKTRKGVQMSSQQKLAMKKMSQFDKNKFSLNLQHPELVTCWSELAAMPKTCVEKAPQPPGLTQQLLPFQLEGLNWMVKQEKGPWAGGMLADEMGMGKTIQTISLILSDYTPGGKNHTLVLAPTVAIMQWRNEIEKFTKGFKVAVFHGANRLDNVKELEKYDVVLTSYAVLESGYRREQKGFQRKGKQMKEDSVLHKMKWNRVILDEAHNIKDRACNTAKAAFALQAKYRWCLSGTPLQNRVGELYSLIRFLGADPYAYYFCKKCDCKSLHWLCNRGPCSECGHSGMQHVCYWNNDVLKPIQYGGSTSGEGARAFEKLGHLLSRMMLRRTKVERADDLGLPPRVVNVRRDYFTEEEEEMYLSLFKDVKRKFNTYADEGTVLNNYSNIFTLITRMRQCADHPSLVTHSKTAMPVEHAPGDKPEDILVCRLCLDEAEDAIATSCRHIFCRECIRQYLETAVEHKPECPVCHLHITVDLDQEAIEQDNTGRQGILARIDPSRDRTSTKIEALVEELSKLRTEDHTLKSIVFSQFTSMLDLVARRLQLGGFKIVRLQGTMTPTARDNTIKYFTANPEVTVFLISLKAGGVALNLVEASRVFILDPWWNPAVELQAMDRVHRLGQVRPIVVTRLIIENSIESRILQLQRKKEDLAASALGDDDKSMGRLTPEDLRFLFSL